MASRTQQRRQGQDEEGEATGQEPSNGTAAQTPRTLNTYRYTKEFGKHSQQQRKRVAYNRKPSNGATTRLGQDDQTVKWHHHNKHRA